MSFCIRYAQNTDLPLVKQLWDVCFPGESTFADCFFGSLYDPSRALLSVTEDGRPASMLHMMPYTLCWLGRETPVSYVYGVGTHPDFRMRGLAAGLIDQALFEMHLRGVLFSALIPQEKWLFDFYRPFGYAPVCTLAPRSYDFSGAPRPADENDIPLLDALYEAAMAGRAHILRRPEHWLSQLRECALGGGRILLDGAQGYAVYPSRDDAPSECFGPGARDLGKADAFGCLRVVDAARAAAMSRQAGTAVPGGTLDDPYAPWNIGALGGPSMSGPEDAINIAELAEFLFAGDAPYMQLMHN